MIALGSTIVITGSVLAWALYDPPIAVTPLADGGKTELEAVTIGENEALRGGLLARLLSPHVPDQYRAYLGVRQFQAEQSRPRLNVWVRNRPPLPADRLLVALASDPLWANREPEAELASEDPAAPTFSFRRFRRQNGAIRLRLFSIQRNDQRWLRIADALQQPTQSDLQWLGDLALHVPSGPLSVSRGPVSLPAREVVQGIELEVLAIERLGKASRDDPSFERLRLKCRLFRRGRPTLAWEPLGDFSGGGLDRTHSSETGLQSDESKLQTVDVTVQRTPSEPNLQVQVSLHFRGGVEDVPDGTQFSTIRGVPILRSLESRRVASFRDPSGQTIFVTALGSGASLKPDHSFGWKKQQTPVLVFQAGNGSPRYGGAPYTATVVGGVDQDGKKVVFMPVELPGMNPLLAWDRFGFTPNPGSKSLTIRHTLLEPLMVRVQLPNPFYLAPTPRR